MDPETTPAPAEEAAPAEVSPEATPEAEPEAPAEAPAPEAEPEDPAAEPEAPAAEEPVVAVADGEIRFSEEDGKHFWKRYDATGALVFTSSFFATEEEARADAEAAA